MDVGAETAFVALVIRCGGRPPLPAFPRHRPEERPEHRPAQDDEAASGMPPQESAHRVTGWPEAWNFSSRLHRPQDKQMKPPQAPSGVGSAHRVERWKPGQ